MDDGIKLLFRKKALPRFAQNVVDVSLQTFQSEIYAANSFRNFCQARFQIRDIAKSPYGTVEPLPCFLKASCIKVCLCFSQRIHARQLIGNLQCC